MKPVNALWILVFLLVCQHSVAHESRPGFLRMVQADDQVYQITWQRPAKGDKTLSLNLRWPNQCVELPGRVQFRKASAMVETWKLQCEQGIQGQAFAIDGLRNTLTDVLVKVELNQGWQHSALVKPSDPQFVIPTQPQRFQILKDYGVLGVEHILGGIDHLLFVFALIFVVSSRRGLIWSITAFTLAHSITLVSATLDLIRVPGGPVEAIIALSIVFLAKEMLLKQQGQHTLAIRWPWLVAFGFGLIHGLGFAGALQDVGLPQQDVPAALFAFNVGVEVGQLLFVAVILFVGWLLKRLTVTIKQPQRLRQSVTVMSYGVGTIASIWFFERLYGF